MDFRPRPRMDFQGNFSGGRGNFGMNGRGRGRGGSFGMRGGFNGPMNGGPPRMGRGRGGPMRGPPRMGMGNRGGMMPGMNRGRGRYPSGPGGDYFQNQSQGDNSQPEVTTPAENVNTEKPIAPAPVTQSSNNVQVVTSGQTQPAQPPQQQQTSAPAQTNPSMNNSMSSSRGAPRGRSSFNSRGTFSGSRGRGGFGQGPIRQFDTRQPSNLTQPSSIVPIKRGAMSGPPGPKRGRYDQGPGGYVGNRNMNQSQPPPMQQHHQNSYNNVPPHSTPYQDQSQYMDQYQHSGYNNSMPPQSGYTNNGYGQSYATNQQMGYAPQPEYDQSASGAYQDYSASSYPTHDSRYAGYSQDYRQQYGSTTDYSQVAQDSTYAAGSYDRNSYGNYDSYSQSYNGQSGYY